MKKLVVIPTYNEAENIEKVFKQLFGLNDADIEVLVVDDNSPDGTARCVEELREKNNRVHLIQRPRKLGLGTAYVAGFKFALQNGYDFIFEMDADLSHDPAEIPRMLDLAKNHDLVIGSRYLSGVNVVNWPLSRLLLSYAANIYTRLVTGLPINDCTSGFKCYRRNILEAVDLDRVKSDGYAFQIEMKFKAWKKGFRICEIPIIFVDRHAGTSKMSKRIVREAALMVWKLKWLSMMGKI